MRSPQGSSRCLESSPWTAPRGPNRELPLTIRSIWTMDLTRLSPGAELGQEGEGDAARLRDELEGQNGGREGDTGRASCVRNGSFPRRRHHLPSDIYRLRDEILAHEAEPTPNPSWSSWRPPTGASRELRTTAQERIDWSFRPVFPAEGSP